MNEYTPTTSNVRRCYVLYRAANPRPVPPLDLDEFDRWLAAHDQGIRDAVKPPAMTAREHLEAAFDGAFPVSKGQVIQKGTRYLFLVGDHEVAVVKAAMDFRGGPSARTLEPLPPLIPDDCKEVRASSDEDPLRSVWIRDARAVDAWVAVTVLGEVMRAHTNDLIDPKPVPEEER